ncbi:hypothetical protein FGU71_06590 [Erythrobacter insulae]|uniref:Uncharacterized protein n=1 Tax=Erythrobacter insulae TaxID=2584124 RepID=A0A547PBN8_9SPHN|nr:hypothetical protein [Erythrobacter insulae]TRD11559.1 hypothetical protein FGU71_06590 [Erythrobacter insulae]
MLAASASAIDYIPLELIDSFLTLTPVARYESEKKACCAQKLNARQTKTQVKTPSTRIKTKKKPGTKAGLKKFGRGCLKGTKRYVALAHFSQVRKAHGLLQKLQSLVLLVDFCSIFRKLSACKLGIRAFSGYFFGRDPGERPVWSAT